MSVAPSPALPSGVVTFLFTDIGGSTRLFQRWGDQWHSLLDVHDAIVTGAFAAHGGVVVSHEGDGYLAVFDDAAAAVRSAAALQSGLSTHAWPADGEIRVRVGLHTGYALPRDDSYVALPVHQAARVVQAAHPGQSLLTEATVAALGGVAPGELTLADLGAHRLKDFDVPQPLFELQGPGLASGFPPLPGVWRGANNLPLARTSFVGRARDNDQVRALLKGTRLVTLVGPGGSGKTRLATQVAASVLDGSGDGVWLVELATVTDAALVAAAIMRAIGIEEQRGRPYVDTLTDAVRERRLLLVLDNCEHLVDACAAVVDALLNSCPSVVVLATSRQPLDVEGEQLYRLPPLGLPPSLPVTAAEAAEYEAIQLFVERARAHQPDFELDAKTVEHVTSICQQLEGMPLAIELAAARLRSLPVDAIAARLDDQMALLVGSHRSAAPRQQTVRALVDWSYDLLDAEEQRLLRRLSVFVGGWTLDAATVVAGNPGAARHVMLDRLSSLVDKSLVQAEAIGGDVRYSLLETVRQYGDARLRADDAPDHLDVRRRHRDYYLTLAEQARSELNTREQRRWLERLDLDDGNLREALGFTTQDHGGGVAALRFVGALSSYWVMRGRAAEGMQHADRVLAVVHADQSSPERAGALTGVAAMLIRSGDFARARSLLDEGLSIAREVDDPRRAAIALNDLAWLANRREDLTAARALADEALALAEGEQETHLAGRIHATLGDLAERCDDLPGGRAHFEEARRRFEAVGDIASSAKMLNNLGLIDLATGDHASARVALEQCLTIFSELQDVASLPTVLSNLGLIAVENGDDERARELFIRGLRLGYRARDKELMVYTTLGLALAAAGLGETDRAITLHGIADALAADLGMSLDSLEAGLRDRSQAALRASTAVSWDDAYKRGLAMDVEEAVTYALADSVEPAPATT